MKSHNFVSQEFRPVCVCVPVEKSGYSVPRAMLLAACDMLELGLIHSHSLAGSGIPIVM